MINGKRFLGSSILQKETYDKGDEHHLKSPKEMRLFIDALNAKSNGKPYFRLPTSAEFVYAVCGDSDWIFSPPHTFEISVPSLGSEMLHIWIILMVNL
jgi:hypothetical protein